MTLLPVFTHVALFQSENPILFEIILCTRDIESQQSPSSLVSDQNYKTNNETQIIGKLND